MGSAAPTLQHKADVTAHSWQRLPDLLLQLQGSLLKGCIAQLLLLISEHALECLLRALGVQHPFEKVSLLRSCYQPLQQEQHPRRPVHLMEGFSCS